MIITDCSTSQRNKQPSDMGQKKGDLLNMKKFNELPGPVTARMCGGSELWIESLCVQTGAMRLDVCGQIDLSHFSEVIELTDINGGKHDPDYFWL